MTGKEHNDAADYSSAEMEGTDIHKIETSDLCDKLTKKKANPTENDINYQFPEASIFPKVEDSPKQGCQYPSKNVGSNVHKPSSSLTDWFL